MPDKNLNEVPRQVREFYDKGYAALERNNLDAAFHFLGEALALEPGFLKARQVLRLARLRKFKGGGSVGKFFGSVGGSAALAKAMANVTKDPAKAMEAADKALASNPSNIQALRVLAEAAGNMDFPLTAVDAYEAAREVSPDNTGILMELGRLYQVTSQMDKARDCYERILERDSNHVDAMKGLKDATANEAMQQGKWETADSYREMIKDKEEAVSLEQQGRIFKDEDVIRTQMDEVYKLTQEQPNNVSHWKRLADLAVQGVLFDYAIDCYRHALEMTKGADGNIEKLISDTKLKKIDHFIKERQAVLAADPQNESLNQEVAALQTERIRTLMEECEGRAKRYPSDLDIRYELARIYFQNDLIDKAIPEFQTAANNPKNKIACTQWLGQCFHRKGMLDMAVQRFKSAAQQAVAMDGLKKEILYNLGTVYEEMNKKAEAIEQFKAIYDVDVTYRDVAKKIEDYYRSQSGT